MQNGAAEEEETEEQDDQDDDSDIAIHGDVAVYLYQVSAYEHYVNSLKFRILFVSPTGKKVEVYKHSYGKKYRCEISDLEKHQYFAICNVLLQVS